MWPCDNLTYLTVPLRSAPGSNEPFCRDQYIQMLDHLRIAYGPNFEISSVAIDLIEFLIGLEFLHERSHLLDLFKLCCLCTTVTSPSYPIVTFGNITTAEGQSRLTNVILPGQNFMANVNGSVTLCSDGSNLAAKFSLLSASFGRCVFPPDYDPLKYTDTFGRSKIYKSLLASYRIAVSAPKRAPSRNDTGEPSTIADKSAKDCLAVGNGER